MASLPPPPLLRAASSAASPSPFDLYESCDNCPILRSYGLRAYTAFVARLAADQAAAVVLSPAKKGAPASVLVLLPASARSDLSACGELADAALIRAGFSRPNLPPPPPAPAPAPPPRASDAPGASRPLPPAAAPG